MFCHIVVNVPGTYPIQCCFQNRLTFWIALNIGLPAVHVGVARVREYFTSHRYERAMIGSIPQFLLHQGNTRDVDSLKPRLNLTWLTFADVNSQRRVHNALLLVSVQTVEVARFTVQLYCKGPRFIHITGKGCNALLSVQDLVHPVSVFHEINQAQRVAFQKGLDHSHIAFAVAIDVIALILGLDNELAVKAKQPLALVAVKHESFADIADRPIGMKCCLHSAFPPFFGRIKILL